MKQLSESVGGDNETDTFSCGYLGIRRRFGHGRELQISSRQQRRQAAWGAAKTSFIKSCKAKACEPKAINKTVNRLLAPRRLVS